MEVHAGKVGQIRAAHSTAGGDAMSTTATHIIIPKGAHQLYITPRNFATAVVARIAFCPFLYILKTSDLLATAANTVDQSQEAQDGDTTNFDYDSLATIANGGGAIYVGSELPFRGVRMVNVNTNDTASVLTVNYWKSDDSWASTSVTDGTDVSGDTFKQTGNVTWAVPSDWRKAKLSVISPDIVLTGDFASDSNWAKGTGWTISGGNASKTSGTASDLSEDILADGRVYDITFTLSGVTAGTISIKAGTGAVSTPYDTNGTYSVRLTATTTTLILFSADANFVGNVDDVTVRIASEAADGISYRNMPLFWTRWEVSAALDSTVDFSSMVSFAELTNYSDWIENITFELAHNREVFPALEHLTNDGTGNLIVNVATKHAGRFV